MYVSDNTGMYKVVCRHQVHLEKKLIQQSRQMQRIPPNESPHIQELPDSHFNPRTRAPSWEARAEEGKQSRRARPSSGEIFFLSILAFLPDPTYC